MSDSGLRLRIPHKRYIEETTIVSMRMPKDMLRDIEAIAKETGRTRNDILMLSLEFSLDHLEIEKKDKN